MEQKILKQFVYNKKLKFNEIEKNLGIRSNKLNYHLQKLVKGGILIKKDSMYELSDAAEYMIPYVSDKKQALPVLLIQIGNSKEVYLIKRNKRPYADKLSLPGGRLVIGENISEATKRIIQEKFNIDVEFKKINSISLEHVRKGGEVIHSFVLFFVKAQTKEKLELMNVEKNKKEIVESDYHLITRDSMKSVGVDIINSKE